MKFLIQTIEGNVKHDFSFELIKAIEFQNWLRQNQKETLIKFDFCDNLDNHYFNKGTTPIGSVEFVLKYIKQIRPDLQIKPINVPIQLFKFANRQIYNANIGDIIIGELKNHFIKSNDVIKSPSNGFTKYMTDNLSDENYQISEIINIDSEWRSFIYNNKLVGLQNYLGEFTKFPNVDKIKQMIDTYKSHAPIAYTLDIGVNDSDTFIIEIHDFFSIGLYGFSDYNVLTHMFYRWFRENVILK